MCALVPNRKFNVNLGTINLVKNQPEILTHRGRNTFIHMELSSGPRESFHSSEISSQQSSRQRELTVYSNLIIFIIL